MNFSNNNNDTNRQGGNEIICGRNPVLEALRSGREIDRLLVQHGISSGSVSEIIAKCSAKGILIKEVSLQKMNYYCGGANHQGVAIVFASMNYSTVDEILQCAKNDSKPPFIIICDCIEDPHNLGAIIRTAEASGVHGIIIPKRRSASLNTTVAKTAAGALEYMKVARVTNISDTIDYLKENGIWVFGSDMDGSDYTKTDFKGSCAIVIGNEGKGISTLVAKKCDGIVSLPMCGNINSLNASVAAGILMYEVVRQRSL